VLRILQKKGGVATQGTLERREQISAKNAWGGNTSFRKNAGNRGRRHKKKKDPPFSAPGEKEKREIMDPFQVILLGVKRLQKKILMRRR